jgi:hypothetical protein
VCVCVCVCVCAHARVYVRVRFLLGMKFVTTNISIHVLIRHKSSENKHELIKTQIQYNTLSKAPKLFLEVQY